MSTIKRTSQNLSSDCESTDPDTTAYGEVHIGRRESMYDFRDEYLKLDFRGFSALS